VSSTSGGGATSTATATGQTGSTATGTSTGTGMGGGGTSTSSTGSGGAGAGEPDGPTKLTVVDGVNDYDAIRICFLPYPAGDPAAMPWPASFAGLAFAHAATLDPASLPAGTDIRPTVLGGDLTQIAGKTCEQAIALAAAQASAGGSGGAGGKGGAGGMGAGGAGGAGAGAGGSDAGPPPPVVIASPLAVLPASVFTAKRSLLLAPIGCMGGPGHSGGNAALACGFSYTPDHPTVDLVALGMSRIPNVVHVSLQVVNAAVPLQPTDIHITPGISMAPEAVLATSLPTGGIEPKPPFAKLTLGELGALDQVHLRTYLPMQMFMTSDTPLTEAFANGTVKQADLANGSNYVLVTVGAYPGVGAGPFWHKLTYTLIKADP
jgi:hypothetical protein